MPAKNILQDYLKFLSQFNDLINSYVSDFFTKDQEKFIDPKWWKILKVMEPVELALFLNSTKWQADSVWPLSLLAYRASIQYLSLPRSPKVCDHQQVMNSSGDSCAENLKKKAQYSELEHCFRRHVKAKKQHEILCLAQAVKSLSINCNCHYVLDIGAGQGHLSRLLAFKHGLRTTTIEAVGCHNPKATKFDTEVESDIKKGRVHSRKNRMLDVKDDVTLPDCSESPTHVTATIDPTISVDDFLQHVSSCIHSTENSLTNKDTGEFRDNRGYVTNDYLNVNINTQNEDVNSGKTSQNNIQPQNMANSSDNNDCIPSKTAGASRTTQQFIMTGLHACGDLTATMIRMFVKCSDLKGLASVGCCYMKLKISSESVEEELGYPMSNSLRNLPNHHLTYEALEMACHFVDAYHKRLLDNSPDLQSHCYRAALQEIIVDKKPDFNHGCVKCTIKDSQNLDFEKYATKALTKLGLDTTLTPSQLKRAEAKLRRWKEVVAYYTLRLSLAPVIESLVLIDRLLYLEEHGINAKLVPIFDPLLSPRNFVLLAAK